MTPTLLTTLLYVLVPLGAMVIGAAIAAWRVPGPIARSYIQHLAAGVVFAVVAVEILPEVVAEDRPVQVVIGFLAGVLAMLAIRHFAEKSEKGHSGSRAEAEGGTDSGSEGASEGSSGAFLWAVGVDIVLDGLLVGLSFAKGAEAGQLLTFALGVEMLSLALSISATLAAGGAARVRAFATTVGLGALIVVGAVVGNLALGAVPPEGLELVLSFGLAALLYLVTEELLVEAHEDGDTPLATATMFVGFLAFLIIGMV